jgi:CheY-like chemotaxis protein
MSNRESTPILVVDHDVDALSALAESLRGRGLAVSLASGTRMAFDRAKAGGFDVVVASREIAEPDAGEPGIATMLTEELDGAAPPILVLAESSAEATDGRIARSDVERLVSRIAELAETAPARRRDVIPASSHDLSRAALGELLLVLAAERRSGALTVATSKGHGEIRLIDGDIADAVYVRLEGLKAVVRLLAEREGTAWFAPGEPAIVRRMNLATRALVDEARVVGQRTADARKRAGALLDSKLIAVDGNSDAPLSKLDEQVHTRLRVPASVSELLDEMPQPDFDVLDGVVRLHQRGLLKALGHTGNVQLCGPHQLHLVRTSAERAKSAGFRGAARLVFAATATKLAVLGHTILSLADARPSPDPAPGLPLPHLLASLRLGEGVELDIVALPLIPVYAPIWPMALAGAAVTIRVDDGAAQSLDEACASVGVTILDAAAVFGDVDETSALQVASLIRTALETER